MRGQQEEKEPKSAAEGAPKDNPGRQRKRKADVAIFLPDLDEDVKEMTKKKHRESEMSCRLDYGSPRSSSPTPLQEEDQQASLTSAGLFHYDFHNIFVTPVHCTPLPALCWASKDVVWNNMLEKDRTYSRDVHMLQKHPHLQPNMRAILLDWLMEVSEVYKLHRETYHLAQDYFDRFMATQTNVFKSTLQLIGITCLFIAAKVEEMYPPKVHQFAYVTDEACTEDEILRMEIIIMKVGNPGALRSRTFVRFLPAALKRVEVEECVRWMVPFAMALREAGGSQMKIFAGIPADDMHNIQRHASYLTWLDRAYSYKDADLKQHSGCPVPSGVLTPPLSSEKTEELNGAEAAGPKIKPRMCTPPPEPHLRQ
ncbi:PREDICTED: G1/S-specific cyclin-E1-like [Cyprinodon variegatus]|uniref:G1/S-specific cyclin-E1-like n=1 Tax=Cyprinodon variegatus TaxID=28743 RepID=UPI00074293B0|nr:PREDICTED: G1/S-specific cyclin-E1-like [Cyprinodon variegatus]